MTFLSPLFLYALPLAGIPVILHLLHRRRARLVPFSDNRWLKEAQQAILPRKQLHDLLLLLLRVLLLLFLILFFARPLLTRDIVFTAREERTAVVFVIDVSASMGGTVGGRTVLEHAQARVPEVLRRLPLTAFIGVITVSDRIVSELAPTQERSRVTGRIGQAAVVTRPGDLKPAIELAYRSLSADPAGRRLLVIVSDQARNGWHSLLQGGGHPPHFDPGVGVVVWELPAPTENAGITDASFVLGQDGVLRGEWRILNQSPGARPWRLILGEEIVGQGSLPTDQGLVPGPALQARWPHGGVYHGRMEISADALGFDDVYYIAGRTPAGYAVLFVDGESGVAPADSEVFYARMALESPRDPRVRAIDTIRPEGIPQADLAAAEVLVLANTDLSEEASDRIRAWVRGGGRVLLTAGANWPQGQMPLGIVRSAEAVARPTGVAIPKMDGPLTHLTGIDRFQWEEIRVNRHVRIAADGNVDVHMTLKSGDPLLASQRFGNGEVMVLATTLDRAWTNLPARPVFAPLMREVIAHLADPVRQRSELTGFVGEPFHARLPDAIRNVAVISPDGVSRTVPVEREGAFVFLDGHLPGLYQVRTGRAEQDFVFALNVAGAGAESDVTRVDAAALSRLFSGAALAVIPPGDGGVDGVLAALHGRDVTHLVLAGLFLLFGAETFLAWFAGRRRGGSRA